jgi:hypothetical protein
MGRGPTEQTVRSGAGMLALMALALSGCGTASDLLKSSPLDYFSSSSKATNDAAAAGSTANIMADDIDCPEVSPERLSRPRSMCAIKAPSSAPRANVT